jgi:misacylated tRNA(Ala) deacylase
MKDYDAPMHTAEHILNQTMVRMFNRGRSFSAHIERRKSKCDYHFDRNLTKEELSEIERTVNSVILRDLPVTEEHVSRDVAAERFSLEKLPEDAGEVIRIVNIGDYDSCPCRGQHVTSTKEIGRFQLLSTGFTDGVLRVRFRIAGDNDHAVVL